MTDPVSYNDPDARNPDDSSTGQRTSSAQTRSGSNRPDAGTAGVENAVSGSSDEVELRGEAESALFNAERLTFFTDAVVAIAITLLALDLPRPDRGELLSTLWSDERSAYIAFLISFLVIAINWFGHHRLFRWVTRTSAAILWLDLLWLLVIVLTPYVTTLLVTEDDAILVPYFVLYACVEVLGFFLFFALAWELQRENLLSAEAPADLSVTTYRRVSGRGFGFVVSIPAAIIWNVNVGFICWAAGGYLYWGAAVLVRRVRTRALARRA